MGEWRRFAFAAAGLAVLAASPASAQTLDAAEGVRQTSHHVRVRLDRGVARVEVEMRFESEDTRTAELRYFLPAGLSAGLQALEACVGGRCRRGLADTTAGQRVDAYQVVIGAPAARGGGRFAVARARPTHWAGGIAYEVHAAPVSRGAPLVVRLTYVSELETSGGRLSLAVPPPLPDPRIAAPEIDVIGPDGSAGHYEDETAWWEIPAGTTLSGAWVVRCGARRCARVWMAAAHDALARDVLILVDRSPSMLDVPRARVPRTVAAVLAELPDRSRVRVVGFANRAREVAAPAEVRSLEGADLEVGPEISLGAGTHANATIPFVKELSGREPLVVLLTDAARPLTTEMVRALSRVGATMSTVVVSDVPFGASAAQDTVVPIGSLAERPDAELRRAIRRVAARVIAPRVAVAGLENGRREATLRAGEALRIEGELAARGIRVRGAPFLTGGRSAPPGIRDGLGVLLARAIHVQDPRASRVTVAPLDLDNTEKWTTPWLDAYPPLRSSVGPIELRQTPPVLLGPDYARRRVVSGGRISVPRIRACACEVRGSASKEIIRRMMRTIEPKVRACFRSERRGRPGWSVRALYSLIVSNREVHAVSVTGRGVTGELERCMIDAVDQLVVPSFPGTVQIRYPFVAPRVEQPGATPIDSHLGGALDRLFPPEPEPEPEASE